MKNVMKIVLVLSIILCILLTPTIARGGGGVTPAVRAAGRASNNSSPSTLLCMSSIAMVLFAYLTFVYF
ncbi:unnamed protein product [Withania somnifera]